MCTPPFTRTRINRGGGHSFEQLNIIPNITSNYRSLFIKHLYYAYTNILLYYHNIYYISSYCISYCISVYIFLVNCGMTVRGRMACSLSCIYCILYYYDSIPLLKPNAHKLKNMYHNTLSPWHTKMYQTNCINTNIPLNSIVIASVVKCHNNVHVLRPHSSQSKNESQKAIHSACDFEDEPQNIVIHKNCFNAPDPSTLGNIDPDIHYFSANNMLKNTPYYNDKTFQTKFGKNQQFSMFHLNIRSIPDHFSELTSLLTEIKVIAISETWLKPSNINFNIHNYKMEQELRPKKRAGGVALYLHTVLQYKVRNDVRIGSDPESINSIFVEIDKSCVDTTRHIIVGCVYRPPWFNLSQFNELLNKTLDLLNKNHYVFLLGDFNVDLTQGVETNLAMEEFKILFLLIIFFH